MLGETEELCPFIYLECFSYPRCFKIGKKVLPLVQKLTKQSGHYILSPFPFPLFYIMKRKLMESFVLLSFVIFHLIFIKHESYSTFLAAFLQILFLITKNSLWILFLLFPDEKMKNGLYN